MIILLSVRAIDIFTNIILASQLQSLLIPILSHLSRGSVHSCQGEISGELKLVAAYQIFMALGLAKQQMQNIYHSLSKFPVSTAKLPDGGPKVASTPASSHALSCIVHGPSHDVIVQLYTLAGGFSLSKKSCHLAIAARS